MKKPELKDAIEVLSQEEKYWADKKDAIEKSIMVLQDELKLQKAMEVMINQKFQDAKDAADNS